LGEVSLLPEGKEGGRRGKRGGEWKEEEGEGGAGREVGIGDHLMRTSS
jgi:hypothetical protein